MSHEIRTPLNAILGLSHLLGRSQLTLRQQDYLGRLEASARSLLGIVSDILDFSKIEAEKLTLEEVEFDLEEVLRHVTDQVSVKAEEKQLELAVFVAPDTPTSLIGDPLRLGQVLLNLAFNAVKFTEQGSVALVVEEVSGGCAGGTQISFEIRDTGIGMTEQQRRSLFLPFDQGDASTTRRFGGTGLGLSISRRLVDLMGGEIEVKSSPGKGSTFRFRLPAKRASTASRQRLLPGPGLFGTRVLVVDDNGLARRVLREMMRSFRFEVETAEGSEQALQVISCATRPFDLVLIDAVMPGLDGLELARRIRRNKSPTSGAALLLATPLGADDRLLDQAQELFDGVVHKPVGVSTLLDAVTHALQEEESLYGSSEQLDSVEELATLAGVSVLLAEDNELNQLVAREILTSAGIDVTVVGDGVRAVEEAASGSFDAVLLDLQMPGMDGLEATRRIRLELQCADLPIIAMTAHATADDRDRCLAAGMDDHVAKPIEPGDLLAALARNVRPDEAVLVRTGRHAAITRPATLLRREGYDVEDGPDVRPPIAAGTQRSGPAADSLAEDLVSLARLLAEYDTEVLERIDDLLGSTDIGFRRSELEALRTLVARYDFDAALRLIGRIAARAGVDLQGAAADAEGEPGR